LIIKINLILFGKNEPAYEKLPTKILQQLRSAKISVRAEGELNFCRNCERILGNFSSAGDFSFAKLFF